MKDPTNKEDKKNKYKGKINFTLVFIAFEFSLLGALEFPKKNGGI